uniref:Uncharacterized protein n=1 Tax=Arundo donax TaxID=35708 RepID=A0A0A9BKT1_ARUDO
MYTKLQRSPPPPPPPRSPSPRPRHRLQIVDGVEVPIEQEIQYKEYCRRSANCEGRSCLCHMCFFEMPCAPNGIVASFGLRPQTF